MQTRLDDVASEGEALPTRQSGAVGEGQTVRTRHDVAASEGEALQTRLCGAAGEGRTVRTRTATPRARGGRGGLGAPRQVRRVEGLPSQPHAVSREGGLRRDALGGRCLSRGPRDVAGHGRRRRERGSRRRQFTSPPAASWEGGRRYGADLPSPLREGGRRCPVATLAASSDRGTLEQSERPNVSIQSWAPNLARGSGQDSVTIGCNALLGKGGSG